MRAASIDLAIVAGGYVLVFFGMGLAGAPYPGVTAILAGVLLASWRLIAASQSWRDLGLRAPERPWRTALAVVALYVLVITGIVLIVEPLARAFEWPRLELQAYADLQGDAARLATLLLIAWTSAAFGEELLFRGFLLRRLESVLGNGVAPTAGAVTAQALAFGLAHAYLGPRGMATAAVIGVIFGGWYVRSGRNLWPLIIAHGLTDTISLFAIYAGLMPA